MTLKEIGGVFFLLIVVALLGIYYFMPFNELEFTANPRNYNFSLAIGEEQMQFYPNMRLSNKEISYKIVDCPLRKQTDMLSAFDMMENITILEFYPVSSGEEITVTCDEKAKFQGNMFIAGEGGPTQAIRAGNYHVILTGAILLIRPSSCPTPNIAVHELLHVLGFIHSKNPNNIMYNFTNCKQTIGDEIPELINELYSIPSKPNLVLENASAFMKGRYLDLNFSIKNNGFAESKTTIVHIKMGESLLKEIQIKGFEIGRGQVINLKNIFVSKLGLDELELFVDYPYSELDKEDNSLFLELKK